MSNVIPLHSRRNTTPPPLVPAAEPPAASVARLPQQDRYVMRRRPPAPRRKGSNGHHPDCPYGAHRDLDPARCNVCVGLAKGKRDKPATTNRPATAAARTA